MGAREVPGGAFWGRRTGGAEDTAVDAIIARGAAAAAHPSTANSRSASTSMDADVKSIYFRWLGDKVQQLRPGGWGTVLDAGIGRASLCWLLRRRRATR